MAKLKNPFLSFSARGALGSAITFVRRRGRNIAESTPVVPDARTLTQLSWRHMFQKVVALWHALSAAEKQEWESAARPHHMTGYAWFVSQSLRPNPGIYLPLQGGTMSGDIDMDLNKILNLPAPTVGHHPATKSYTDAKFTIHEALPNVHHTPPVGVGATNGTYTGNDGTNRAIPHGLGTIPKLIMIVQRRADENTYIHHIVVGIALIFSNNAANDFAYGVTAPDATNFYVGDGVHDAATANDNTFVYYWAAIG